MERLSGKEGTTLSSARRGRETGSGHTTRRRTRTAHPSGRRRRTEGAGHHLGSWGRVWRALSLLAAAALTAALVGAVSYAHSMEPQLRSLPSIVRTRLEREHSVWIPYNRVPPALVDATIATEDRDFWTNPGISFEGIARAALVDIEHGAFLQGASTLQQQIIRDIFLSPKKTISRKLRGIVLSIALTRDFPRKTIFALYVNEVYYGNGAYGIARAARSYFGESPQALTPAQCTLLAGLPQAPSYLDPLRHPKAAKARQTIVVDSMVAVGYLTAPQAQAILRAPWHLVRPRAA